MMNINGNMNLHFMHCRDNSLNVGGCSVLEGEGGEETGEYVIRRLIYQKITQACVWDSTSIPKAGNMEFLCALNCENFFYFSLGYETCYRKRFYLNIRKIDQAVYEVSCLGMPMFSRNSTLR